MVYRTCGIVLKVTESGEADFVLTLLSEDFGKVTIQAQGVRKSYAKLRPHIQPLTLTDVFVVATRGSGGGFRLVGAETVSSFREIKRRFSSLWLSRVLAELVADVLIERVAVTDVFALLKDYLSFLDQHPQSSTRITFFFLWKFLKALGYEFSLSQCAVCGTAEKVSYVSGSGGGVVCENCSWGLKDAFFFPVQALSGSQNDTIEGMLREIVLNPAQINEALRGLFHFLSWHCEVSLPAFSVIFDSATIR